MAMAPFAPCAGRAAAQSIEIRAGIVGSTPLAEDRIANPRLSVALGEAWTGSVRARPAAGPMFALAARAPLRGRGLVEVGVGWTATHLNATDAAGTRELESVGVGQATLGVRYRLFGPVEAGCGFGLIRYFANAGLFADGSGTSPLIQCGGGLHVGPARHAITLRAIVQAHRFRTPVLRDAGAQSGSVIRFGVQAGFELWRRS